MAPTLEKPPTVLWASAIVVLVVNCGLMVVPIFIHSPIIQNLIKPFTTAIFMMEALLYLLPPGLGFADDNIEYAGSIFCVLFIVVFAILDIFLQGKSQGGEQEAQDQQEDHKPEGGKPSLDNMGNFKIITAVYVVIMWITYMMDGMVFFSCLKWEKNDKSVPINFIFYHILASSPF